MRLAVMQPYFFPYLGYFQLMHASDQFVLFDDVNFIKRGYIHTNNILLNGETKMFSVPLSKASQNVLIKDVSTSGLKDWLVKFQSQLHHAYSKAPNYTVISELVHQSCSHEGEMSISDLASLSLKNVCKFIGLDVEFSQTSSMPYKRTGNASEKIQSICELKDADEYLNPINGRHMYDVDDFSPNGIKLSFLKMKEHEYSQLKDASFVTNLSILDLLMFLPKEQVLKMTSDYEILD